MCLGAATIFLVVMRVREKATHVSERKYRQSLKSLYEGDNEFGKLGFTSSEGSESEGR